MKKLIATFLILISIIQSSAAEELELKDVTILVSSYDKAAPIWPTFFDLLFKEWPSLKTYNKDVPIMLLTNAKNYKDSRVTLSKSPFNLKWTGNMTHALSNIKTKYVLYLQDDYFMSDTVLEKKIIYILNLMKKNDLDYAEISPRCAAGSERVSGSTFLLYKDHKKGCFTTLQAALWKTKTFLEFTSTSSPNIWAFEDRKIKPHHKFAYYTAKTKPLKYENFIYKGHLDFRPYIWLYYEGYDLRFADAYKIHPKYKIYNTEVEWFRQNTPRLAKAMFYTSGFFFVTSKKLKKIIRWAQDYYSEKTMNLKTT
jgi:hypothetical protein